MIRKLQIGDVQLENNLILAPMAGVTDLPFRLLCKEQGAGLLCMEMVSAKAISFHNKNTISLMQIDPVEHPVSMQKNCYPAVRQGRHCAAPRLQRGRVRTGHLGAAAAPRC